MNVSVFVHDGIFNILYCMQCMCIVELMDKSWMVIDRRSAQFRTGFDDFFKFAFANASDKSRIPCPCLNCFNSNSFTVGVMKDHVFFNGISTAYTYWRWHGEGIPENADVAQESESVDMQPDLGLGNGRADESGSENGDISSDCNEFLRLVEDADKPLYPGCTKTIKLNALIQTFNLKAKHGMTDSCYSDMLLMLSTLFPEENEMPDSMYDAKKALGSLGLGCERIHACPNDCILYRGKHEEVVSCDTCGASRWKKGKDGIMQEGVPGKVLWYFPPILRFKRMFSNPTTAKDLTWHANGRKKDGKMQHPADSPTWDLVDTKWLEFGAEPRNLRLALSSDGFNPHSMKNSQYSCWPVILVTYNLPPWLCMKRKYMMLTLLISEPKQPGNDIDVYLQPLIDDLKKLWQGVEGVYDAALGELFTLRAVLFWTINDFPAYGNLSGCVVKGYNGCPICCEGSKPRRLTECKKVVFMKHRRFLPRYHPYRKQAAAFDNTIEKDVALVPLTGEEVLSRVESLDTKFGKKNTRTAYKGAEEDRPCWHKKSVFYELEYWKYLPIRYMIDVMHVEKNCADALVGTILNTKGKTKDGKASRNDMVEMEIRTDLKPIAGRKRVKLSLGSWNLRKDAKKIVCNSFFGMKAPVRFCSNIRNLVSMKDLALVGMKSHDCHIVMQHLLPIAIRSVFEKPVRYTIIRFCLFFKAICAKVIDVSAFKKMQADLMETVCLLEKYFPPSFFDVMIHLTVHLVREVEFCGPVFFRWMYPFERYMKVLKGYVNSRKHPEGCIAEKYILEEAIEFGADRLLPEDIGTAGLPKKCISGLVNGCKRLSACVMFSPGQKELQLAHLSVLRNTEDAQPYFIEPMKTLEQSFPAMTSNKIWMTKKQNQTFCVWLKERVEEEMLDPTNRVSETIRWMSGGPKAEVASYQGYHVNGVDFNTKERDNIRSVQNSGVFLVADKIEYYGVVELIWEVNYYKFSVPLFKCEWVDTNRAVKVDELGFTLVKLKRIGHRNDPFVLPTHVKQVFYIEDPLDAEWSVVMRCSDMDYEDLEDGELEDAENMPESIISTMPPIHTFDDVHGHQKSIHKRGGDEAIWVTKKKKAGKGCK